MRGTTVLVFASFILPIFAGPVPVPDIVDTIVSPTSTEVIDGRSPLIEAILVQGRSVVAIEREVETEPESSELLAERALRGNTKYGGGKRAVEDVSTAEVNFESEKRQIGRPATGTKLPGRPGVARAERTGGGTKRPGTGRVGRAERTGGGTKRPGTGRVGRAERTGGGTKRPGTGRVGRAERTGGGTKRPGTGRVGRAERTGGGTKRPGTGRVGRAERTGAGTRRPGTGGR